jgi:hypothetical protein
LSSASGATRPSPGEGSAVMRIFMAALPFTHKALTRYVLAAE